MATKTSRISRNLNFLGEPAFLGVIFCLEYPSRHSEKVNCHFVNYRLSFRKLQIVISQTTEFHFANYRFQTKPFSRFWHSLHLFISPSTFFAFFYSNIFYKTRPVATCSHGLPFIFFVLSIVHYDRQKLELKQIIF